MNEPELKDLLAKYKEARCTEAERSLLEQWILSETFPEYQISEEHLQQDLIEIGKKLPLVKRQRYLWQKLAAAASIILAVSISLYLYHKTPDVAQHKNASFYANDIVPGKKSATLILANGKKIILSDVQNGEIVKESGIQISKTVKGQLVYEITNKKNTNQLNTLSTGRGETYQVRLPDGSSITLNSASSLTYATSLNGRGERIVELKGEAYFDVAKDPKHPFIVKTGGQEVKVLGTRFNISDYYTDSETKTTLLEGKVKVTSKNANNSEILNPGQQTVLSAQGLRVKNGVDLEEVVAWKKGYFKFNGSLEQIMQKVARWYDIEVIYLNKPDPALAFGAEISMQRNLSELLKIIESTGNIHFKIEGRRVFVM